MKKKLTPIEQVEKAERKNSDELDDIVFDPQDNFYLTFGD